MFKDLSALVFNRYVKLESSLGVCVRVRVHMCNRYV